MKKPNAEVMEARVRELIETGKSKGVLTYKEIVEMLGDVEMDSEQFDRILDTLSGLNIDVVKDESSPRPFLCRMRLRKKLIFPCRKVSPSTTRCACISRKSARCRF